MIRNSTRRLFSRFERLASKIGYELTWKPPLLLSDQNAALTFDLEFVIAHLMLAKKNLYFLQIGANDGVTVDPLHKFVTEYGWSGILVEPIPHVFESLRLNYKNASNLKFVNAALSDADGFRTMYTVRMDSDTFQHAHAYSSFDRSVISRQTQWIPDIANRIEETQVRSISMATLLRETEGRTIDLLQIDAEGYDFEILKMIDFSRLKPAIICYEHAHLGRDSMNHAVALLVAQGYRITRDRLDTIAYRAPQSYGWRSTKQPGQ